MAGFKQFLKAAFNPEFGKDLQPMKNDFANFKDMVRSFMIIFRILPANCPSMGLLQMLVVGARNLTLTKEAIPSVAAYFFLIMALLAGAAFVLVFLLALMSGSAFASSNCSVDSMFEACSSQDQAIQWIDYLFNGKQVTDSTGFAVPQSMVIQESLKSALGFYSKGILALAGLILLYQLFWMVVETAHTGKVMGNANQVAAPLRLVIALALLIPIGAQLNAGQYLVIAVAKMGSGFASQTWNHFMDGLVNAKDPVMPPTAPPFIEKAVRDVILMKACMIAYNAKLDLMTDETYKPTDVDDYKVSFNSENLAFSNEEENAVCGSFSFPVPAKPTQQVALINTIYSANKTAFNAFFRNKKTTDIAQKVLAYELDPTKKITKPTRKDLVDLTKIYYDGLSEKLNSASAQNSLKETIKTLSQKWANDGWVSAGAWFNTISRVQSNIMDANHDAVPETVPPSFEYFEKKTATEEAKYKNRSFRFTLFRSDEVAAKSGTDAPSSFYDNLSRILISFNNDLGGGATVDPSSAKLEDVAAAGTDQGDESRYRHPNMLVLFDIIDWAGATMGAWPKDGSILFPLKTSNPLAELAALGHSNMEMGMSMITVATIAGLGGGIVGTLAILAGSFATTSFGAALVVVFGPAIAAVISQLASFMTAVGALFIATGSMLAFFLPLIPFIRFFFAVLSWMLTLFEAVVSIPVFALAHLTTKGDTLVGASAQRGYHYMLSIFLRPVLTVFGLIAGLLLFTITIFYLNKMFLIATAGTGAAVGGFGTLSKILFSIIYVFLAYLSANTCFKTITHFPDHALDWMSAQGHSTKDLGDPASVASVTAVAADYIGTRGLAGTATGMGKALGESTGQGIGQGIQIEMRKRGQIKNNQQAATQAEKSKLIDASLVRSGKLDPEIYKIKHGEDANLPNTQEHSHAPEEQSPKDQAEPLRSAPSNQQNAEHYNDSEVLTTKERSIEPDRQNQDKGTGDQNETNLSKEQGIKNEETNDKSTTQAKNHSTDSHFKQNTDPFFKMNTTEETKKPTATKPQDENDK